MLTVEDYERIRRAVMVEGKSQREAAKELGYSRKTVRKALAGGRPAGYQRRAAYPRPAMGTHVEIIEAWQKEDEGAPRKQRHTGQRIFERLRDERGYAGSASAVRRFLQARRRQHQDVFVPLVFRPGEEAQFDWGEAKIWLGQVLLTVCLFCVRLCHSRAVFVRAYPTEKMEAFLDGHVRAFRFFGGVPRRGAYDNLKTAVLWVGRSQKRRLHPRFVELRSHYLFESRFCNVGAGWEKGHVENLVKLAQRSFMTPVPKVASLDELNANLETACLRHLELPAPQQTRTRGELLAEEQSCFLPLPQDFAACLSASSFASKYALVTVDGNAYSVPVRYAHHGVQIKAFVDRVDLYHQQTQIATHARSYERGRTILEPLHYVPLLARKPGILRNGLPFQGTPFGAAFERMRRELECRYEDDGTRKYIRILRFFETHPEAQVKAAVEQCVAQRTFSDEAVEGVLRYQAPIAVKPLDLTANPLLQSEGDGVRSACEYDAVLLGQEETV